MKGYLWCVAGLVAVLFLADSLTWAHAKGGWWKWALAPALLLLMVRTAWSVGNVFWGKA